MHDMYIHDLTHMSAIKVNLNKIKLMQHIATMHTHLVKHLYDPYTTELMN